jgi:hypothetical protein
MQKLADHVAAQEQQVKPFYILTSGIKLSVIPSAISFGTFILFLSLTSW